MDFGDIYMVDFNPVVGSEQGNYRPCLIVSNEVYHSTTRLRLVVPISSVEKYGTEPKWVNNPLIQPLPDENKVHGFVLCSQLKTIDLAKRRGKKVDSVDEEFASYVAKICKSMIG
jgi:mRNA-degrading endonuclease toxin of MazEF toxin-antitoxin module